MHLTNPTWVNHDGGAIYSLDLHPIGNKLATCGQGSMSGNGLVIVWNLLPIKDEKSHADSTIHKVLAKIEHGAGVNCVRWSPSGSLLACASDDKVVTIYEYGGRVKSSGTIGKKEVLTVEKYKTAHSLHSHSMEVLSVEWSPDGRYLASSSMDNTVAVWNAKKLPERIIVLDGKRGGHSGPVKGVSFDPIGKYLASQSADKSLRVWTTDSWQCETAVTEPFAEGGQTTMFSRVSWSADGQFIFAPCAMNNLGPVAQVIRRKDWDTSLDIVGHRRAVTAIRVSPRLLHFTDQTGKKLQVSLMAVGSRDKSLSIWVFPLVKRPIIVLNRLFKHSIMDMSWKGLDLAICSQDGSIKYISFSGREIGQFLTDEEMAAACHTLYKQCPVQFESREDEFAGDKPSEMDFSFVETAEQLVAKRMAETRTGEAAAKEAAAAVAQKKAEILQEKRKEQVEVRGKDGKRRIQPIFLASVVDEDEPTPETVSSPVVAKKPVEPAVKTVVPAAKRARLVSTDESTAPESSDDDDDESQTSDGEGETTAEKEGTEKLTKSAAEPDRKELMMRADFKRPALRPSETSRVVVTDASTILDVPEQLEALSEAVIGVLGAVLNVDNRWMCAGVATSRLAYVQGGIQQWTAYVGPPIAIAVANRSWTMVGCFDRSLRVYSSLNGIIQCTLRLDSAPVRVGVAGNKVYALTQTGRFSSWDVSKSKCLLSRQPIADCVTKDASLTSIAVSVAGMPLIGFSTGELFTFSPDMQCWLLIDDASTVARLYDGVDPNEMGDGQLGRIFKRRRRAAALPNVPAGVRCSVKQNQLESWLSAAEMAGCSTDYRRILLTYTQQLIKDRATSKLKSVLTKLSGAGTVCGQRTSALKADVEGLIQKDPATASLLSSKTAAVF